MTNTDLQVSPKSTYLSGEAGRECAGSLCLSRNNIPVDVLPERSLSPLLAS